MAASRCVRCEISYPLGHPKCGRCQGALIQLNSPFDVDWHAKMTKLRKADQVQAEAEAERAQRITDDPDRNWRLQQFLRLGIPLEDAENLAERDDVDYHQLERLLQDGCDQDTALRIIA